MRITSLLRAATLVLALTAATVTIGSAFASESVAAQPQSQQSNSGPYDGADFQAASHAFN